MSDMRTKLRKIWYRSKRDILTPQNVLTVVAIILGLNWTWSAISTMHRNYDLQRRVEDKRRQALILELETLAMAYESSYYRSREFQELAAREMLGLAREGERLLILPPNSPEATHRHDPPPRESDRASESNAYQWMTFLFGGNWREE